MISLCGIGWVPKELYARLAAAGGFDVVDAGEGEEAAEEFEPGAAFAQEEDAEGGAEKGQEIGERGELGGFKKTEDPEVEHVCDGGAEQGHVHHADPNLPGDGEPVVGGADENDAMDGDGENDESTEEAVEGGHGEGVVAGGDAFAEDDVGGETEGGGERDQVAEKRGRMAADARASGHEDDSTEGNAHTKDFAERGVFQAEEYGEDERVNGRQ